MLDPRTLIAGSWKPGDGGCWDRLTALRVAWNALGVGSPQDTQAQLNARIRRAEDYAIQWARENVNDFAPWMTLNASGYLGVGTTAPAANLHVLTPTTVANSLIISTGTATTQYLLSVSTGGVINAPQYPADGSVACWGAGNKLGHCTVLVGVLCTTCVVP